MLKPADVRLVGPEDELPPAESILETVVLGDRLEIPLAQPSARHVVLLTLALTAIATPLCLFLAYSFARLDQFPIRLAIWPVIAAAWIVAVFGPAFWWLCVPTGAIKPHYLVQVDRDKQTISLWGGWSTYPLSQILCICAVADLRKRAKRTELQLIVRSEPHHEPQFVTHCRQLDPQVAYGQLLREISQFSGIPACVATIATDGSQKIDVL